MFAELRELLRSGAIRRHQLGSKYLLTPISLLQRLQIQKSPRIEYIQYRTAIHRSLHDTTGTHRISDRVYKRIRILRMPLPSCGRIGLFERIPRQLKPRSNFRSRISPSGSFTVNTSFFDFLQRGVHIFLHTVLVMRLAHGALRNRVCKHTDLRKHIDDRTLRATRCKILNDIQTDGTAADYDDFLALAEIIRVLCRHSACLNHLERSSPTLPGCDVFLQSRESAERAGTDPVASTTISGLNRFTVSTVASAVQEDIQVVQTRCTCFQIFRKIFHTGLARQV